MQTNVYLTVLHIIDRFLAYSDFTVGVAYNALMLMEKIPFSIQFIEIACEVSITLEKIHTFCL